MAHIERKTELKRRRKRKDKLRKLKGKLARAKTSHDQQQIVLKIKTLSPFWIAPKKEPAAVKK